LSYTISADQSAFTVGMQKAGREIVQFGTETKAVSAEIQEAMQQISQSASNALNNLSVGGPGAALRGLGGDAVGMAQRIADSIGPLGVGLAGAVASMTALITQGQRVVQQFNEINKTARVLGETPRNTQVLLRAFEQGGFDRGEAQSLLLKFENHLGDLRQNPNSAISRAFERIGLDPDKIAAQDLRTSLAETFEALNQVSNGFDRAHAAREIFGRGSVEVAELIARGRRSLAEAARDIERYGPTEEQISRAGVFLRQQREFEQNNRSLVRLAGRYWDEWVSGFARVPHDLDYSLTAMGGRAMVDEISSQWFGSKWLSGFLGPLSPLLSLVRPSFQNGPPRLAPGEAGPATLDPIAASHGRRGVSFSKVA
jgi:hypothetical protein